MRITVGAAAVFLSAISAAAQDWPGWRGANRDGKIPGFEAPATWPGKLARDWSVEVGGGHSTPALVAGKLYVFCRQGEEEVLLCLDAETGKEAWRSAYRAPYTPDPAAKKHGHGPFASPAVAGGRVFTYGISGILSAFDAETGKRAWQYDSRREFPKPYPEWGAAMSPLVVGDTLFAHLGGKGKGAVVAFDAATGKKRWSNDSIPPSYVSPFTAGVKGKTYLFVMGQNSVAALDPNDGTTLWEAEYKTPYEQNSVAPIPFGDVLLLFGTKNGVTARPFPGKGGATWTARDASPYMSDPVLKGDRLYGFSERRRGQFFCLDAGSGEVLWAGDGRAGDNAAVLDGGSVLLALTTGGELIVFDADDKAYVERARYPVADSPTWAHPVISGRAVHVKDAATLTRWRIP